MSRERCSRMGPASPTDAAFAGEARPPARCFAQCHISGNSPDPRRARRASIAQISAGRRSASIAPGPDITARPGQIAVRERGDAPRARHGLELRRLLEVRVFADLWALLAPPRRGPDGQRMDADPRRRRTRVRGHRRPRRTASPPAPAALDAGPGAAVVESAQLSASRGARMLAGPYRGCRAGAGPALGAADAIVLQRRPGCRRAAGGLDRVRRAPGVRTR